jgi:hypothetical protein
MKGEGRAWVFMNFREPKAHADRMESCGGLQTRLTTATEFAL